MKKLAHIILACFAAQLLFVVVSRASIATSSQETQSSVNAMPYPEDGTGEGF